MKLLLFTVSLVSVAVVWMFSRMTTADLRAQVDLARQQNAEMTTLQREHDRLQRLQREAEESTRRERAAVELARARKALAVPSPTVPREALSALTLGEWLPTSAWKNRGQATPLATVETALWAAAGGDIATLKDTLQLDDSVRAKADAILARLPESSRAIYPSPEHLIAAFTSKSLPLGDAQLVWQNQPGPDDAVACVFVKNTDTSASPPSATSSPNGPAEKIPPLGPPSAATRAAYLSLHRNETGWRLVVPLSAVDKIAQELSGSR